MKISETNFTLTETNFNKINSNKNNEVSRKSNQKDILNNSISETIGRSQVVSFSGRGKFSNNLFSQISSTLLGEKEELSYNKTNGSFVRTITNRKGEIKLKEECYPEKGVEIVTELSNGITTITETSPFGIQITKTDSDGDEIYFEKSQKNGNRDVVRTDYDNGRKIITRVRDGQSRTSVINLETGLYVFSGDLIYETTFNEKTGYDETRNLLTNQIVKVERYNRKGFLLNSKEYSEKTGKMIFEKKYDSDYSIYEEYSFDQNGLKTEFKNTSLDEKEVEIYTYDADGQTVKSHIFSIFDDENNLSYEEVFDPKTNIMLMATQYLSDGRVVTTNNPVTGKAQKKETYNFEKLVKTVYYQKDGETLKAIIEETGYGSKQEIRFTRDGKKELVISYDFNNNPFFATVLNPETGRIIRTIEIDFNDESEKEIVYDEITGRKKSYRVNAKDDKKISEGYFYEDGETLKIKRDYDKDGSFVETEFDAYGNITSKKAFNSDGSPKIYRQKTNSANTQKNRDLSIEDFLQDILDRIDSDHPKLSKISENEWQKLVDFFGLANKSELLDMDKKTYRKVMKENHPDGKPEDEIKKFETASKLANTIYAKSPNNGV